MILIRGLFSPWIDLPYFSKQSLMHQKQQQAWVLHPLNSVIFRPFSTIFDTFCKPRAAATIAKKVHISGSSPHHVDFAIASNGNEVQDKLVKKVNNEPFGGIIDCQMDAKAIDLSLVDSCWLLRTNLPRLSLYLYTWGQIISSMRRYVPYFVCQDHTVT